MEVQSVESQSFDAHLSGVGVSKEMSMEGLPKHNDGSRMTGINGGRYVVCDQWEKEAGDNRDVPVGPVDRWGICRGNVRSDMVGRELFVSLESGEKSWEMQNDHWNTLERGTQTF